ncbi:MAG: outer membrane lipid asymmetry maintenance protein MlaD [Mangrovicoccus sp.]
MSENITEVAVGGVVLAVAVGFLAFTLSSTGGMQSKQGYPLNASFRSAEGVSIGTDVRLAGVKIGTVSGMSLNAESFRADTVLTIQDGIVLPDDSSFVISSEGLLGGYFVEILPGGSPFNYESGDKVSDTQGSVSLITLLMKFVGGDQ